MSQTEREVLIEENSNADGSTNWATIEAGECREYFRFSRKGQPGWGAISSQGGKWFADANNGNAQSCREISRDVAVATVAKIKSQPALFAILRDFSSNI